MKRYALQAAVRLLSVLYRLALDWNLSPPLMIADAAARMNMKGAVMSSDTESYAGHAKLFSSRGIYKATCALTRLMLTLRMPLTCVLLYRMW